MTGDLLVNSSEIDFLARMVGIDTDSEKKRGYVPCANLIENEAKKLGLKTRKYDHSQTSIDGESCPNVIVDLDVGASERIILATHYDIVPPGSGWTHDPFRLRVEGDKAYGRGTSDDKGAIVAALYALAELADRSGVNISLLVSPDEEVGGARGVKSVLDNELVKGRFAVVLDASPDVVGIGASGALEGKITIVGKQGHAGYPHMAANAITLALPFLQDLNRYSITRERVVSRLPAPPGSPRKNVWGRFSITVLKAGEKENIIPGICEVGFDVRICPDEDYLKVREEFLKFFDRLTKKHRLNATMEFTEDEPSNYCTDVNSRIVTVLSRAVDEVAKEHVPLAGELGANDGRFFANNGIPAVCFGVARNENQIHGVNEFVYLRDIDLVKQVIVTLGSKW